MCPLCYFNRGVDDKTSSVRTSLDVGDQFAERGRSKQRFFPSTRPGGFAGKYDR